MEETTSPALRTALAYYHAWTSHDLDQAMTYIADDITCDAPAGRLRGAQAYRGFLGPFVQFLTRARLIAAYGDESTALLMYDAQTRPVPSAPGAECLTVTGGQITYSRFIFDRVPFEAARRAAAAARDGRQPAGRAAGSRPLPRCHARGPRWPEC